MKQKNEMIFEAEILHEKKPFPGTAAGKGRKLSHRKGFQMFGNFGVVNAEELVGGSHHVNVEVLTFGTLSIHELKNGIIGRRLL